MEDGSEKDNVIYEIRTQTGIIVLLILLNLFTVIICIAAVWYGITEKA